MIKLQVLLGSTRPGRAGEVVAEWVHAVVKERKDISIELVDIASFNLPLLDEPMSAFMSGGKYTHDHTKAWSDKIAQADGYIFITPEYNHSMPGALKNAIDFLYPEWNNKAAGFVSYGVHGGTRAVEHLRVVAGEVQLADVREQLALYLGADFENYHTFKPTQKHQAQLQKVIDQVAAWSKAMQPLRK
jgi:NAD(P)H-dependent FMN reductase